MGFSSKANTLPLKGRFHCRVWLGIAGFRVARLAKN